MAAPIYNPVIPFLHPIPGGMYPGRMIRIQGNVPPGGQRFAINFQCGPNTDPRDDIALHLNFRFVEMCVVRNHLTAMNWGVEETSGGMPLARGEGFEALILCEPQSFKVALNGIHFCEFLHRVPFQRISHLTIDGDVHVQFIGFEGAQPPQQMYMAEPPAYGSYGAPPPAYGAPGYGAPQGYTAVAAPVGYQAAYGAPQQRSGLGTGAAVGLGVGALAAGGLAGYALGGGFSNDSPTEGYTSNEIARDDDYLESTEPEPTVEPEEVTAEAPAEADNEDGDDDYLENDNVAQDDHEDGDDDERNKDNNDEVAAEPENIDVLPLESNDINNAEVDEQNNPPYEEAGEPEPPDNEIPLAEENGNAGVNEEENAIPPYVEEPAECEIPPEEGNENAEDESEEVNTVDNFGDGDWME